MLGEADKQMDRQKASLSGVMVEVLDCGIELAYSNSICGIMFTYGLRSL